MRRGVHICEHPGCTAIVKRGHPYPQNRRFCDEHEAEHNDD